MCIRDRGYVKHKFKTLNTSQFFLKEGPLAILPFSKNYFSFVWSVKKYFFENNSKKIFFPTLLNCKKSSFSRKELLELSKGNPAGCFDTEYDQCGRNPSLKNAPNQFLMSDRVVSVIPHGVDLDRFSPSKNQRVSWSKTGMPGEYGIINVGRVRPEKGTDLFVEAMIDALPQLPKATAIIAGATQPKDHSFRKKLEARIEQNGLTERIRFLGEIPSQDLAALLEGTSNYLYDSAKKEKTFIPYWLKKVRDD